MKKHMKQIMTKLETSPNAFEHSNKGHGDSVFSQDIMYHAFQTNEKGLNRQPEEYIAPKNTPNLQMSRAEGFASKHKNSPRVDLSR